MSSTIIIGFQRWVNHLEEIGRMRQKEDMRIYKYRGSLSDVLPL